MSKATFVIGVNGVGKTTVMDEVGTLLSKTDFELHDFDERGVPNNADKTWRISETDHWISVGKINETKNISTVIFGFSKPEEIGTKAQIVLLDATPETIESRIKTRYLTKESINELNRTTGKTVEKFIADNIWISSKFRESCEVMSCKIIKTDNRTPAEIAKEVVIFLK